MRISLVIPFFVSAPLLCQDAWTQFLEARQLKEPLNTPWTLIHRGKALDLLKAEDAIQSLLVHGDLAVESLDEALAVSLWNAKGWTGEDHWLLLDPSGRPILEGQGLPSVKILEDVLSKAAYQTRLEKRRQFLKQHPLHGEAWLEHLDQGFELALRRIAKLEAEGKHLIFPLEVPAGSHQVVEGREAEALTDSFFAQAAEALVGLSKVPDGWRERASSRWATRLSQPGMEYIRLSPRMRQLLGDLTEDLARAWRREPVSLELSAGLLWVRLRHLLDPAAAYDLPGDFTAPPEQVWPSITFIDAVCKLAAEKNHWEGMLAFLSALPEKKNKRELSEPLWRLQKERRSAIAIHKAWAQGRSGQWDNFRAAVREAKRYAGMQWISLDRTKALESLVLEFSGERQEGLKRLLQNDLEPELPAPAPREKIRLVLYGSPEWKPDWPALLESQELSPWGPDEMAFESRQAPDPALKEKYQWQDEPRWALFFKDELLATSQEYPEPRVLAAQAAAIGLTRLQELDEYLSEDPDNLDMRRERCRLLKTRMPHPVLEERLAEDAKLTLHRLDFDRAAQWKPGENRWAEAATSVMTDIENTLVRWPSRVDLWRAWVSWAPFHPYRPSALLLVGQAVIWGDKVNWTARMPKEIHEVIAQELRRTGRWDEMRAWFQDAYNGLDKRALRDRKGRIQEWLMARRRQEGEFIVHPLREALELLKSDEDVMVLDQEWKQLTGVVLKVEP